MNDKYDVLKKEIVINAPVEKVYSALITPEQLTLWFPNIVTIEPKIGGKISFRFLKESTQEDKDWLYPQMIQVIKMAAEDSIIRVFSPTKLSNLVNYERIIR